MGTKVENIELYGTLDSIVSIQSYIDFDIVGTIVNSVIESTEILKKFNFGEVITNTKVIYEECMFLLKKNEKIYSQVIFESQNSLKTKYHKENLLTHLFCVGTFSYIIADLFDIDKNYAFKLGFFHDIGKPWAKKIIVNKNKTINNYNAHPQIGEHICKYLGLDKEIIWCTSHHMCSCSHHRNYNKNYELSIDYQLLSFDYNELDKKNITKYINSLACLMLADDLGRLGDTPVNFNDLYGNVIFWKELVFKEKINTHNFIKKSVESICKLHPDNSIIINMYGHSGFGKSTCTKILYDKLTKLGISCEIAERDPCYYKVYSDVTGIPLESLEYSVPLYQEIYKFITDNELKIKVQNEWINRLNQILDSDSKVKIIDSVQLMYPGAWESTITSLSEDAKSTYHSSLKLGYYGFPQSILEREYIPKTGSYEIIPREPNDSFTWPTLNSELSEDKHFSPNNIDISYGTISPIINTITNYKTYSKIIVPNVQPHILTLINNSEYEFTSPNDIIDYITKLFPPGIIQASVEINHYANFIIRFSYIDGRQIFHGPSRDYRGEMLLYNKIENSISIARTSLPVFVDYSDMRKDPKADELIHSSSKFNVIPKFDGSLFVLTWIKKSNPEYENFIDIVSVAYPDSYQINDNGIWCFGSKGCMFAKNQLGDSGILKRIYNSVKASYGSIDNFLETVHKEIIEQGLDSNPNVSVCFEAIDVSPTDELTVDYGRAFCPMLCWVIWDGEEKRIILPENITYINPVSPIYTFDTWEQVIEFKDKAHERLLDGSEVDEPEGYVVWIDKTNIGIKLKHPEYYVAHKPYSEKNIKKAKQIEFDPIYSKLKTRLVKFRPKPPIEDLINDNILDVNNIFILHKHLLTSRKDWAIYWKSQEHQINKILDILENNLTVYYPIYKNQIKNKGFKLAIKYFENSENSENFNQEYLKYIKSYL